MMPEKIQIYNLNRPDHAPISAVVCKSFLCQLRGLTFRSTILPDEGLLMVQTKDSVVGSSIHMLFMWIDLTIVWINTSLQVVDVKYARRWHLAYFSQKPARFILETSVENQQQFKIGDQLSFERQYAA
jgi:uncharacterized membrane protein (UPF0127 family)